MGFVKSMNLTFAVCNCIGTTDVVVELSLVPFVRGEHFGVFCISYCPLRARVLGREARGDE